MKVVWYQPGEHGGIEKITICTEDAIDMQMRLGKQKGYPYTDRNEALMDFVSNNWAWITEDEPTLR